MCKTPNPTPVETTPIPDKTDGVYNLFIVLHQDGTSSIRVHDTEKGL